jgi:hypothetical protein
MRHSIRGYVKLEVVDADGNVLQTVEGENLITNVGHAQFAAILGALTATLPQYLALGITNTAANVTDTAMASEIVTAGGQRKIASSIVQSTGSVTNDKITWTAVFTFTGSFAIVEAGLFDAVTAGNLFARKVFSAVNVVNGNTVNATWAITF